MFFYYWCLRLNFYIKPEIVRFTILQVTIFRAPRVTHKRISSFEKEIKLIYLLQTLVPKLKMSNVLCAEVILLSELQLNSAQASTLRIIIS